MRKNFKSPRLNQTTQFAAKIQKSSNSSTNTSNFYTKPDLAPLSTLQDFHKIVPIKN